MKKKVWIVTNNGRYLPPVGNGDQWQYPVFYQKKDAISFSKESHGINNPKIFKADVVWGKENG